MRNIEHANRTRGQEIQPQQVEEAASVLKKVSALGTAEMIKFVPISR